MTREEEIENAMKESVFETIYASGYGFTPRATDLLESAFIKGAKWADQTMLEKSCKWLIQQEEMIGISFEEDFIERFKKAMKGDAE